MMAEWSVLSGLARGSKSNSSKASRDKPDVTVGVPGVDDGVARHVLLFSATSQRRRFLVMQMQDNLSKEHREDTLKRFRHPRFRKSAVVLVGQAPQELRQYAIKKKLQEKQEKADQEMLVKVQGEIRQRITEARKRNLQRQMKKAELEKKRKLQCDAGETIQKDAGMEEDEVDEDLNLVIPDHVSANPVTLTEAEKRACFQSRNGIPDLATTVVNTGSSGFSLPSEDEAFDSIRFEWLRGPEAATHLQQWIRDRKMTTRVEDLQPSEWFRTQWVAWQKDLKRWQAAMIEQRAAANKEKLKVIQACLLYPKLATPKDRVKEQAECSTGTGSRGASGEHDPTASTTAAAARDGERSEDDPRQLVEAELENQNANVYDIDDIINAPGGPLFEQWEFEDWNLLQLRFELYLLVHAFRRDCKDEQRDGMHPEHVPFYFSKYYKRPLAPKAFCGETVYDLLELVKDAVVVNVRKRVLDTFIDAELERNDIFVKLTEDARRERLRRVLAGRAQPLRFPGHPADSRAVVGTNAAVAPLLGLVATGNQAASSAASKGAVVAGTGAPVPVGAISLGAGGSSPLKASASSTSPAGDHGAASSNGPVPPGLMTPAASGATGSKAPPSALFKTPASALKSSIRPSLPSTSGQAWKNTMTRQQMMMNLMMQWQGKGGGSWHYG